MILGHLSASYLAIRLAQKNPKASQLTAVLIGSYAPDLMDKGSVIFFELGTERGLGHTLMFNVILAALCELFARHRWLERWKGEIRWFVTGCFLHLLGDLVRPQILLWPFLGSLPPPLHFTLLQICHNFYVKHVNIPVLVLEITCHSILLIYWTKRLIFRRIEEAF